MNRLPKFLPGIASPALFPIIRINIRKEESHP